MGDGVGVLLYEEGIWLYLGFGLELEKVDGKTGDVGVTSSR